MDCERNVLYRNPHIISKGGGIVITDLFGTPLIIVEIKRLSVGPDLLAQLMAEQTLLPEMEPPPTVTTTLFRYSSPSSLSNITNSIRSHQKQALIFMLRRELGYDLKSNGDI